MTDKKLTDGEIVKALECCKSDTALCTECPYYKIGECIEKMCADSIDLINRQKAIIEKSEKVEHFADKTIETANAEIENLKVENQSLRSAANSLKMHYEEAQAEIERLKESLNIELENFVTEYDNKIKDEAYKECIEKVRKLAVGMHPCSDELRVFDNDLDNLLKELVGEDK